MSESEVQSVPSPAQESQIVDSPVGGVESTVDEELDALLRHAENMTEIITSNADIPPEEYLESIAMEDESAPTTISPAGEGDAEPTATHVSPSDAEPTASDEADIDSILNEVDVAIAEANDITDAASRDLPDLLNDPEDASEANAEAIADDQAAESVTAEDAPVREVLYIPDDDIEEPAQDEAATDAEPAEPETAAAEEIAEPQAVAEPVRDDAASASTPVVDAEAAAESPKPTFLSRVLSVLAIVKKAIRIVTQAPRTCIVLLGAILGILNKPFDGVSERTRTLLGLVAIATLVCAVLAWILPWVLTSNPFERLPLGITFEK